LRAPARYPGKINDVLDATLKGLSRTRLQLIPYIPLVIFNPVLPEKASKLVLKRNAAVMLLLPLNIPVDTIQM
jgi:hypothetical protein